VATRKKPAARPAPARTFDARPDALDIRDRMYEQTLTKVLIS
jgi:hypothetical protein